ncbi:hypothetical protein PL81_03650, partial [Streptomyces sp. RSD-27]
MEIVGPDGAGPPGPRAGGLPPVRPPPPSVPGGQGRGGRHVPRVRARASRTDRTGSTRPRTRGAGGARPGRCAEEPAPADGGVDGGAQRRPVPARRRPPALRGPHLPRRSGRPGR